MKQLTLLLILSLCSCGPFDADKDQEQESSNKQENGFELEYQYLGKAVEKAGTHVWGSSPIRGKDGKIHLYVAEWPMPTNPDEGFSGWYHHCRIGHYVGDSPEGPYEFVRIAVKDQDGAFNSPHNPTIQFIDDKYILHFIVNENNDKGTQRIIMYVADDLKDNWRPAKGALTDGTILQRPAGDTTFWNHDADRGVSNPSFVKFKNKYMLYFKSVKPDPSGEHHKRKYGYGVAISDSLEGPYKMYEDRVTPENLQLEDAYAFTVNDKMYMLSRDFRGTLGTNGGGLSWSSDDGLHFSEQSTKRAFEELEYYMSKEALASSKVYRGERSGHLERPQLLLENGKPAYLFVATGINDRDGYGSCSHIFKIGIKE